MVTRSPPVSLFRVICCSIARTVSLFPHSPVPSSHLQLVLLHPTTPPSSIDTTQHHAIKTYRSNGASSSNAPSLSLRLLYAASLLTAFPAISGELSTSPLKRTRPGPPPPPPAHGSPVSPPLTTASAASSTSQVHLRPCSFTLRLPSKISVVKPTLIPLSPQRTGSASSERDKGSAGSGASRRFTFPVGGISKTSPGSLSIFDS
ncbi:hypothetical protein BD309DRAFT_675503 [Dichomitus squalens]|nr:hypothetical protein BD309DRAFT_675503 [Dichomitus squalens]